MRPIKFRGRNLKGELVYGSYYYEHFTDTPKEIHAIISEYGEGWRIDPNSVAQLVGYDEDGKEVYEGDELTNEDGKIFIAHWETAYRSADLIVRNRNLTDGCAFVLKEKKS